MNKQVTPFNKIFNTGKEFELINEAINKNSISGSGYFSKKCEGFFKTKFNFTSFITNSCTSALEATSLLSNFKIGDEIIMPSYTFVGSATPFVLRGCIPVFVDIRPDTQNIDEDKIEDSITNKTKAILVVHYAGIACELKKIKEICQKYNLLLIEDAAQAIDSKYNNKYLGSFGDFSAFSFHDTKNITSGEGGLLVVNNSRFYKRAEMVVDKGTNRSQFLRGEIDKYTWRDLGSSYIQSEITAAFLFGQLKSLKKIQTERKKIWNNYKNLIIESGINKIIDIPHIPNNCLQNYHMFYLLFKDFNDRENARKYLLSKGINTVSHYIPLHSSPGGKKFGRFYTDLKNTKKTSRTILRLPMWVGLSFSQQEKLIHHLKNYLIMK